MSKLPLTLHPELMRGKTVLFRADLNVPMQDGQVTRIQPGLSASLPALLRWLIMVPESL